MNRLSLYIFIYLNFLFYIKKFNNILNTNHILLPEYVYILLRGIALIEGIGQQLDADLNVQKSMRPYAAKLAKEKLYPQNIAKKTKIV